MGLSGIGWGEMLVVLLVVVLIFGTGKLARIGGDLGAAIRSFRSAMSDAENEASRETPPERQGPGADATPRVAPEASVAPEQTRTKEPAARA